LEFLDAREEFIELYDPPLYFVFLAWVEKVVGSSSSCFGILPPEIILDFA